MVFPHLISPYFTKNKSCITFFIIIIILYYPSVCSEICVSPYTLIYTLRITQSSNTEISISYSTGTRTWQIGTIFTEHQVSGGPTDMPPNRWSRAHLMVGRNRPFHLRSPDGRGGIVHFTSATTTGGAESSISPPLPRREGRNRPFHLRSPDGRAERLH